MALLQADIAEAWANSSDPERREILWIKQDLCSEIVRELRKHAE